jgi:hypothetical protein
VPAPVPLVGSRSPEVEACGRGGWCGLPPPVARTQIPHSASSASVAVLQSQDLEHKYDDVDLRSNPATVEYYSKVNITRHSSTRL